MKLRPNSGMSLVITLAFLVLVTIMIVGLSNTVRVDRSATNAHMEKTRATLYAEGGLDQILATLRQATGSESQYWLTTQGELWVGPLGGGGSGSIVASTPVLLSSGQPTTFTHSDKILDPCNLNTPSLTDPAHRLVTDEPDLSGSPITMRVKWVYVRQSGALDLDEAPNTGNKTDPIVGRFAFWADDQSSKINLNLAWKKSSSNPNAVAAGHPTLVDLTVLPGFAEEPHLADTLHTHVTQDNYLTDAHFFNTPADARRVSLPVSAALELNRSQVTNYNSDPDTTFFNERRILLTTNPNNVPRKADGSYACKFIEILNTGATDPGPLTNINDARLAQTLDLLRSYLQRTDWPMASSSSFQAKYYGSNPNRLTQLALQIIDYVRSREAVSNASNQGIVAPLRGTQKPGAAFVKNSAVDADAYMGVSRSITLTEVGIWISSVPDANGDYDVRVRMELHLPANYGLSSVRITGLNLFTHPHTASVPDFDPDRAIVAGEVSSATLAAGQYVTVTRELKRKYPLRPASVKLRIAIGDALPGNDRIEIAPLVSTGDASSFITVPIDAPAVALNDITSVEVDDPRVNKHFSDWKPRSLGSGNTFGAPNSIRSVGQAASGILPQQDADASGHVSDASCFMPMPAVAGNDRVSSVGELGYVHTGVECGTGGGVPWRTLRLQPNSQGATVVPDWALLDLFAAPRQVTTVSKPILTPHGTSVGGRVNLHSRCTIFAMERLYPLAAVFKGARPLAGVSTPVTTSDALEIARHVTNHDLAIDGKDYGFPHGYYSAGQVAEILGVADQGEASEALVRDTVDILTARGNVFEIHSVGQALKQTLAGKLTINSETRIHSIVERWIDSDSGDALKFRTLFRRGQSF